MAQAFGDWIQREKLEMIMPVPVHKKRLRFRGFNQAEILAEKLGECLDIPVRTQVLVRTEDTKPQKTLDVHKRIANLQKGFAVTRPVEGRRLLLVDDIYTTGATLEACGNVLKELAQRKSVLSVCVLEQHNKRCKCVPQWMRGNGGHYGRNNLFKMRKII